MDIVGEAGSEHKYWSGMIRVGIPFAIINLVIICVIYLLLAELGHLAYLSSNISEMPAGIDTSGLARTNSLLSWGVLLALAISPFFLFGASTLAGIVSAAVNAVGNEKEAVTNGRIIGSVMWAIVMIAALAYFGGFILNSFSSMPPYVSLPTVALLFVILVIPVVLILWVFVCFSRIGSRIFIKEGDGSAISASGVWSMVKKSFKKGERAWIKTAIGALLVVWTVLLFYGMLMIIANLH